MHTMSSSQEYTKPIPKSLRQVEGTELSHVTLDRRKALYAEAQEHEENVGRSLSSAGYEGDAADAEADTYSVLPRDTAGSSAGPPSRRLQLIHRNYPSSSSSRYDSSSSSSGSTMDTDKLRRWHRAYTFCGSKGASGVDEFGEPIYQPHWQKKLSDDEEIDRKELEKDVRGQDEAWQDEIRELRQMMESMPKEHGRSPYGTTCNP